MTLSVPPCCGFTSLPDADPFLVNTERGLGVEIKLNSGQIIIVWFLTVLGKNFHMLRVDDCASGNGELVRDQQAELEKKMEFIGDVSVQYRLANHFFFFPSSIL